MTRVVLSLGSNLGDRLGHLQAAVDALRPEVAAVSPVYETAPVGPVAQGDYLNAVVVVRGDGDARAWLGRAQELEAAAGRVRVQRWGPRTLDVDLIVVDDELDDELGDDAVVSDDDELTLPHPRAHERAFVLVPWSDVEPDAELPGHGPVRDLVAGLDTTTVRRVDGLVLR